MSDVAVACNASPLIALAQIHELDLLQRLFGQIHVPPAVVRETARTVALPAWVVVRPLVEPMPASLVGLKLGSGETEAIALALEMHARRIILDDLSARRAAQRLGLPVIGTLGILLAAKRHQFIPTVRPRLDALVQLGFRIAPNLRQHFLQRAGESP